MTDNPNLLLNLKYEPMMENLGDDYYDIVTAAEFPAHWLRFRNDSLLPLMGLNPADVSDGDFIEAFGKFNGVRPFLALRYHGYQFGAYNPFLGDGRGFLYGQIRRTDGELYELGTKGSGRTPYSRTADGRLTLKGGIREVIAAEALHQLGVKTSRCLSLIETGESLWRGDEPSPTRSSVMVRFSNSHIRFGTFERLHYLKRPDLIAKLLDGAIEVYYPELAKTDARYIQFYGALVDRVARLAAQWMAAGFCHGVLNTDNMSIAGESFDYGPYAFIPTYDSRFTAASFDYGGRYSYGNQPYICKFNLELFQAPLAMVADKSLLEAQLVQFDDLYQQYYRALMGKKLGFVSHFPLLNDMVAMTVRLLKDSQIGYHHFFAELAAGFNYSWREDSSLILKHATFDSQINYSNRENLQESWCNLYHKCLNQFSELEMAKIGDRLSDYNPATALLRPVIESVWQSIAEENNWQPFDKLVKKLQNKQ